MKIENTTLTIYADLEMKEVLDTWEISDEKVRYLPIEDEVYDQFNGSDWWEYYASDIESKFGNTWRCFEIVSADKASGRIIDRNSHLQSERYERNFSWMSKVFLFGDSSWENIAQNFSGSVIYQIDLAKVFTHCYYRLGTDEKIISEIRELTGYEVSKCSILDVVINPAPTSLLAMKLAEPYKYQIYIPTKSKVRRLHQLYGSLLISNRYFHSLRDMRGAIDKNELSELRFLSLCVTNLEILRGKSSPHSLYSKFMDEFIYK